uniref:Uncharacterized protein n=1 Tax=Setaria viridis TaxID=4556 RepID=A0A4U6W406_SETVI|nr:hypothetical protein SEVIR_1G034400v2 [Setaria viridis]
MDPLLGQDFSSKVWDLRGVPVFYDGAGSSLVFLLLVSFSHFRFRLHLKQLIIVFALSWGLDDQIFQFGVSCKRVGLLVLQLRTFSRDSFKLTFHLCNDSGFEAALDFSKSPLIGANRTPLGLSRPLNRFLLVHQLDHNDSPIRPRISIFKRISYTWRSIFERLNFWAKVHPQNFQNLTGQQSALNCGSKGPYVLQPNTVAGSNNVCKRWFKQPTTMTSGPNLCGLPVFASFQDFSFSILGINERHAPSASLAPLPQQENPSVEETRLPCASESPPLPTPADDPTANTNPPRMAFLNINPNPMMLLGFKDDRARKIACPFGRGQAYVRLVRISDRNGLVLHSPHQHEGFNLEFINHNRGPNARRVTFNRECWLMLIGYPLDYRSNCEILRQNLLGGMPQDEDIPPEGLDENFVFPGLGLATSPLVETAFKRSSRIRVCNDGFKQDSCASKGCLACSANPPAVPLSIIKRIGESACMIPPEKLTDRALKSKPKSFKQDSFRQAGKGKKKKVDQDKNDDDDEPQKKTKN